MGEYAVINYSNPARPWVGVARGGMGEGGGGGTQSVILKKNWGVLGAHC